MAKIIALSNEALTVFAEATKRWTGVCVQKAWWEADGHLAQQMRCQLHSMFVFLGPMRN
jgi:hypothetical protein